MSEQQGDRLLRRRKYCQLVNRRGDQARAIADHYTAYAKMAATLLELIRLAEHVQDAGKAHKEITRLVETIIKGHATDLGIALEWTERVEDVETEARKEATKGGDQ